MPAQSSKSTLLTWRCTRDRKAHAMNHVFKAFRRATRAQKDVLGPRRPRCSTHFDCPAFVCTSNTSGPLSLPVAKHHCATQGSLTALLQHQALLLSLTLHTSTVPTASSIISFPLAQTGEGIKECELTQWYVKVCVQLQGCFPSKLLTKFALRFVGCAGREPCRRI